MASSAEFVEYVCGQLSEAGEITSKRMFGEYGIYLDGKFIAMVCDDQLFVKESKEGRAVIARKMGEPLLAPPYEGGKPCLVIEELDDRQFLAELLRASYEALPMQKPRSRRKKTEQEK